METTITPANYDALINGDKPMLIDFYADWCGPCRQILPYIAELAEQYSDRAVVARCNVDDCRLIAARHGVRNIPTVLFIKNGQVVNKIVGAAPKAQFEEALKAIL